MIKHLMLATDGSAAAERAAIFTATLAMQCDAQVTVVHAFAAKPEFMSEADYLGALHKQGLTARAMAAEVARRLRDAGVDEVLVEVVEGPTTETILRIAEARTPDLIVVGARGLGPVQGLILGSISNAITQHAACPVLIVK